MKPALSKRLSPKLIAVRGTGYGSSKFHLATGRKELTLCGREAPTVFGWLYTGDAENFLTNVSHRVCKPCRTKADCEPVS